MGRVPARRRRRVIPLAAAFLACLSAAPAAAQTEPYPPTDPPPPEASIVCELRAEDDEVVAICTGQGLDPAQVLALEVSGGGRTVARSEAEVGGAGTASARATLACDELGDVHLTLTGRSTDPAGREVTGAAEADAATLCATGVDAPAGGDGDDGTDVAGTDARRGDAAGRGSGGLAFTGGDLGLLIVIGLLLALAGYGLTRSRARHPA